MNSPKSVNGRCFCGSIEFELAFPTDMCGHCHCESCRKAHSSAFTTWVGLSKDQFKFLKGESQLKRYSSSAAVRWGFCSQCGTSFHYEHLEVPNRIWITLASLTGPIDRIPDSHVSYEEHVKWFDIKDELPRFREKSTERMD